jgi:hypothetical protein
MQTKFIGGAMHGQTATVGEREQQCTKSVRRAFTRLVESETYVRRT